MVERRTGSGQRDRHPAAERRQPGASKEKIREHRNESCQRGGSAHRRFDRDVGPVSVLTEEQCQTLVGPSPQVDGARSVGVDTVRRHQDAAAGRSDPVQFAHGGDWIDAVIQNLGTEDDVEGGILDR